MSRSNALGSYLRARREQVDPASVGLHVTGVRRTPGLRREEVATLAGISADYYLRLEQGRDRNPSVQVLESLARVLGLDDEATRYLLGLVGPRRRRRRAPEKVPDGILQLLSVIDLPAFVESRFFDVLAVNPLATALSPAHRVGENRLRSIFLDPAERELYVNWSRDVAGAIAAFRTSLGTALDDPAAVQLVGELSLQSPEFRTLWARQDVKSLAGAPVELQHPVVGRLSLYREKLPVGDSDGQVLAVFHAARGSAGFAGLERLRALVDDAATSDVPSDALSAGPSGVGG